MKQVNEVVERLAEVRRVMELELLEKRLLNRIQELKQEERQLYKDVYWAAKAGEQEVLKIYVVHRISLLHELSMLKRLL